MFFVKSLLPHSFERRVNRYGPNSASQVHWQSHMQLHVYLHAHMHVPAFWQVAAKRMGSKENGWRPHVPLSTEMIFPAADVVVVVVVVVQFINKDMNRKPQGMFCKQFVINDYERIWFLR